MKRKIGNFLAMTSEYYGVLEAAIIVSYSVMIVVSKQIPLFIPLAILFVNCFLFLFYKDYVKSQKNAFIIFRIGMCIGMVTITVFLLNILGNQLGKTIPKPVYLFIGMLAFLIATIGFFYDSKKKELALKNIRIKNALGGLHGQENASYDVKICRNKHSKQEVWIKTVDRYLHEFVAGPTGCGKTSLILTPMLTQDMQRDCGVIVVEPKGDLANDVFAMGKYYNEEVIYFNPIMHNCPRFNILDGPESQVIETVVTTFEMMAPTPNSYFKGQNENLIRKSIMVLKRLESVYMDPVTHISSRPATLIGIANIIFNTNKEGTKMVNELRRIPTRTKDEAAQNIETCDYFTNEYYPGLNENNGQRSTKAYSDSSAVRQQISNLIQNKYLRKVLNPENGKTDLNFDEILEKGKKVAITTAAGDLGQLGGYLGYFLILTLQAAIFRRPGNENTRRGCFLYIDEFQKYSNPGFEDILTMGRSFRVGCVLATQSREQLTMGAGNRGKSMLEVIATNCRNIILFPGISATDASYFEKDFGKKFTVQERHGETRQKFNFFSSNQSRTVSTQTAEVEAPHKSSTDLAYKGFKEVTYKIITDGTVGYAEDGECEWIPKQLKDTLTAIATQMEAEQKAKSKYLEEQDLAWQEKAYAQYRAGNYNQTNNPVANYTAIPISPDIDNWMG